MAVISTVLYLYNNYVYIYTTHHKTILNTWEGAEKRILRTLIDLESLKVSICRRTLLSFVALVWKSPTTPKDVAIFTRLVQASQGCCSGAGSG